MVERVDYSSEEEYEQALEYECWASEQEYKRHLEEQESLGRLYREDRNDTRGSSRSSSDKTEY